MGQRQGPRAGIHTRDRLVDAPMWRGLSRRLAARVGYAVRSPCVGQHVFGGNPLCPLNILSLPFFLSFASLRLLRFRQCLSRARPSLRARAAVNLRLRVRRVVDSVAFGVKRQCPAACRVHRRSGKTQTQRCYDELVTEP